MFTRIYYARAVDISRQRADSQGTQLKAGIVNDMTLMNANGSLNQNYYNLLEVLTAAAATVANAAQAGGAVKFVSASSSTVGLSQTFDHLLAIGYLGFDVPVNLSGDIGAPIPTFQYINGEIKTPPLPAVKYAPEDNTAKTSSPMVCSR